MVKKKDEIESWVGITRYDIDALLKFLRGNMYDSTFGEYANKLEHQLSKRLPEVDIVSHLEGSPALFNMMFGKGKRPKKIDVSRYL